jgi:UDP-N-acetylglucosamine transferase subunit ALG13
VIFVTTGTQLPFPRLRDVVLEVAEYFDEEFVAQIGEHMVSRNNVRFVESLDPATYGRTINECRCMVGHAGIGTYLTAKKYEKPLFIMPRQVALGEHRNDHQAATAARLREIEGVAVFNDGPALRHLLSDPLLPSVRHTASQALYRLRNALGRAIGTGASQA